ncbi:hypothetical protein Desdi_1574 [Desulfitobacterium dichloroeliminans LMG P-21439]|uniref:Phosphatidylglycerol lysyltransferase C-terminal domain-containing protein n=1 Tax=Desulfitobacterium dichloroeliminans (strain LMG P-21439 / DCA1) TaxID=871963 RepID=L0F7B4_DESDL|nr:phosphatidylglycerol lysyltransferase domain-containing protein [Desulfitobacterium dichloroeliminans]AGA69067.1 hypothetical protein Desdi_1574 [Desulfitobacterium dichloroeliminans LMG P-21439]
MIEFKRVEISDQEWMKPLLKASNLSGGHQNYTNIFSWSDMYNYQVAKVNEYLVIKGQIDGEPTYYFYPAGTGDVQPVLNKMKIDAEENHHEFIVLGISVENMTTLKALYPDHFEYQDMRDSFDYVYLAERLATLAGRKLQAKRNHINRFQANNDWSFELLTPDNLAECWKMNLEWCRRNNCKDDEQLKAEYCAVKKDFDYFKVLELEGGVIRVEGKIVAFTMGERLNSDTYIIHVEKAFSEIQGAYQIINREFVRWIVETYPDIIYVNREEDMGYEGLRKAKLSYYPDKMEEKYLAKYFD